MEEHVNFRKAYLKYGLFLGIVVAVVTTIINATRDFGSPISYVTYVALIAFIFLAYMEYKKKGDGFLTYSRSLGLGTMIGLIGGVVSGIIGYIHKKFIDPSIVDDTLEFSKQTLIEGGLPESQVEQSMKFGSFFAIPEVEFFLIVLSLTFFAFIFSLVLGAIAKKNNPNPLG